jgi:hypothetical protein
MSTCVHRICALVAFVRPRFIANSSIENMEAERLNAYEARGGRHSLPIRSAFTEEECRPALFARCSKQHIRFFRHRSTTMRRSTCHPNSRSIGARVAFWCVELRPRDLLAELRDRADSFYQTEANGGDRQTRRNDRHRRAGDSNQCCGRAFVRRCRQTPWRKYL